MPNQQKRRSAAYRETERVERSYQRTSGKRKGKFRKNKQKASIIAICAAIAVFIVIIVAAIFLFSDNNGNLILKNVSVAGVNVGGMTKDEAAAAISKATEGTYTKIPMVVKVLDSSIEISPANSGAKLDVDAATDAAYAFGRTGSSSKKKADKLAALAGVDIDISQCLHLDETVIRNLLDTLGKKYSSTLMESTYRIDPAFDPTSTAPQSLVITIGTPEYSLDMDALYAQVVAAYNTNTFAVEGKCDVREPAAVDLDAIHKEYYVAPKDAVLSSDKTTIKEPAKDGFGFNLEEAKKQVASAKYGETVSIPLSVIKPDVTDEDLEKEMFKDVLGKFTATAESDPDRNINLELACKAINGIVLNPDESFSYNEALGERTEAKGYRPGPSYAGNDTVKTIGGGICQVSSALYYSTLIAELSVTKRDEHQFNTGYVPLGMDAMVSWGAWDFVFWNNLDHPIRIEASASGGSVTVAIMGTETRDYDVKMEYNILDTKNYSTSYKTLSADNADGYRDGDVIVKGYTGYNVETYRCKYSKNGNALISRDFVAKSSYQVRNEVICRIENQTDAPVTPQPQGPSQGISGSVSEGGALPDE